MRTIGKIFFWPSRKKIMVMNWEAESQVSKGGDESELVLLHLFLLPPGPFISLSALPVPSSLSPVADSPTLLALRWGWSLPTGSTGSGSEDGRRAGSQGDGLSCPCCLPTALAAAAWLFQLPSGALPPQSQAHIEGTFRNSIAALAPDFVVLTASHRCPWTLLFFLSSLILTL